MAEDEARDEQLLEELRALWGRLDERVQREWKRSLPFADHVVARRERARRLGFGDGATIWLHTVSNGPHVISKILGLSQENLS